MNLAELLGTWQIILSHILSESISQMLPSDPQVLREVLAEGRKDRVKRADARDTAPSQPEDGTVGGAG